MLMRDLGVTCILASLLGCSSSGGPGRCTDECGLVAVGGSGGVSSGGGGSTSNPMPPPAGPFPSPIEGAAACPQSGEVVADISNPADMESWLSRRWVFCTGTPLFSTPHDGVEFTTEGNWYFLDLVEDELMRRQGFEGGGEYDLMQNGDWVQVNITRYQGGTIMGYLRFAVAPLKVNMGVGGDGNPPEYIAVSPAPF